MVIRFRNDETATRNVGWATLCCVCRPTCASSWGVYEPRNYLVWHGPRARSLRICWVPVRTLQWGCSLAKWPVLGRCLKKVVLTVLWEGTHWNGGPGEALHSSGSCLCLIEFHYYLTDTQEATRDLAVNGMVGAGYVNGAWCVRRPLLTVVACVLIRKQVVKWYRTVLICQRGVEPEMARGDVVVQVMGCRKYLACITLHKSGTCPDVRFTAQGTNMYGVVYSQYFWNVQEVLKLLSMCCVNTSVQGILQTQSLY